jgi:hypothetical protein
MSGDAFSQFVEPVILNRAFHICSKILRDSNMILQVESLDYIEVSWTLYSAGNKMWQEEGEAETF